MITDNHKHDLAICFQNIQDLRNKKRWQFESAMVIDDVWCLIDVFMTKWRLGEIVGAPKSPLCQTHMSLLMNRSTEDQLANLQQLIEGSLDWVDFKKSCRKRYCNNDTFCV